jgi:hypothetical protein
MYIKRTKSNAYRQRFIIVGWPLEPAPDLSGAGRSPDAVQRNPGKAPDSTTLHPGYAQPCDCLLYL